MTPYKFLVRKYHPQGWSRDYYAAVLYKNGNKRATTICQHQHDTKDEAAECGQHLVNLWTEHGGRPR